MGILKKTGFFIFVVFIFLGITTEIGHAAKSYQKIDLETPTPIGILKKLDETASKEKNVLTQMEAEQSLLSTSKSSRASQTGSKQWLKAGLAVVFVSSLIFLISSFFNQKMGNSKGLLKRLDKAVKIDQMLSLGLKRQVAVLDFEGSKLVVGITPTSIQTLHVKSKEGEPAPDAVETKTSQSKALPTPSKASRSIKSPKTFEAPESLSNKIRDRIYGMKPIRAKAKAQTGASFSNYLDQAK